MSYMDERKQNRLDDAEEKFGKHLACQLRELPPRERNYAKFKMQEVLYNVRFFGVANKQAQQYVTRSYIKSSTPLVHNPQRESFTALLSQPDSQLVSPNLTSPQTMSQSFNYSENSF